MPNGPEEYEYIAKCVRDSVYNDNYKKQVQFKPMIRNTKTLDERARELDYRFCPKPNINICMNNVNMVHGNDYVQEPTKADKAMQKY